MKTRTCLVLMVVLVSAFAGPIGFAAAEDQTEFTPMGLSVEPGGMLVQHIPLGVTYDFQKEIGISLTIHNRDDQAHTYVLSSDKPSTVGTRRWLEGYLEIPDPSWIWFEKEEVTIEPRGSAKVKMYLNVPESEKHYNQHWAVSLGVTGKAGVNQLLALALRPRVEIETLSKEDVREKPVGALTTVPSTVRLEEVSLGETVKAKLEIVNNEENKKTYKILPVIFSLDPMKRQIVPAPTYSWIPDAGWIKPSKKRIKIDARSSKEVTLAVTIPEDDRYYGRNWEAILMIEPKEGLRAFARVQIHTVEREQREE